MADVITITAAVAVVVVRLGFKKLAKVSRVKLYLENFEQKQHEAEKFLEKHKRVKSEIVYVKEQLKIGVKPSTIANELMRKNLHITDIIEIGINATDASFGEIKMLGRWWGDNGVTDIESFDEFATKAFKK